MIWFGLGGLSLLAMIAIFLATRPRRTGPDRTGTSASTPSTNTPPAAPSDDWDDDDDDEEEDEENDLTGIEARGDATSSPPQDAKRGRNLVRSCVLAVVPVIAAIGIYLSIGHPDLPGRPYADRATERNLAAAAAAAANPDDPDAQNDKQIRRLLSQIVISLEANPRNLQGWIVLARGSLRLGDIDRAVAAYSRAYALSGQNPLLAIEYADTRITAQQGKIDDTSRQLILHALGQMPNHTLTRYYYGLMLAQGGQTEQALHVLRDLNHDLADDSPLQVSTEGEIKSLEAKLASEGDNDATSTGTKDNVGGGAGQEQSSSQVQTNLPPAGKNDTSTAPKPTGDPASQDGTQPHFQLHLKPPAPSGNSGDTQNETSAN